MEEERGRVEHEDSRRDLHNYLRFPNNEPCSLLVVEVTINKDHAHTNCNILPVNVWLTVDPSDTLPWCVETKVPESAEHGGDVVLRLHVFDVLLIAVVDAWKVLFDKLFDTFAEADVSPFSCN